MPQRMIDEDEDMPEVVNTKARQIKWAKRVLAAENPGKRLRERAVYPRWQGSYSRTVVLDLSDGSGVVIQFRPDPLDVDAFTTARNLLGPLVPDVRLVRNEELEAAGVWTYYMNRIPGVTWFEGEKTGQGRIKINKSLGRLFSKGFISENSSGAVETVLRPKVDKLLAAPQPELEPFKEELNRLSQKLDDLSQLPLWLAHADISEVNVLINEDHEITGLVDWENSVPLPFGVGFGCVHSNTGVFVNTEFIVEEEFEEAERGFWQELFGGMPDEVRAKVENQIDLVQDAVILGTLLASLMLVDGEISWTGPTLKALPKFLTYRLPFLRGEKEGAYKEEKDRA